MSTNTFNLDWSKFVLLVKTSRLINKPTDMMVTECIIITHSCGGNVLINVGPARDGTIMPLFEDRLRSLGKWLKVNGEAIYGTKPWKFQNDTVTKDVW